MGFILATGLAAAGYAWWRSRRTAPARRNLGRSVLICVAWSLAVFLVGGLAENPAIMIAAPFLLCLGLIWLGTQLWRQDTARSAEARSEPERDTGIPG